MKSFIFICIFYFFINLNSYSQSNQVCELYGSVYVESNPKDAHYNVFVEESESAANLLVFQEGNRLFADQKGAWFFTKSRSNANFTIFFVKDKNLADFTIFYTDVSSFAGCQ